MLPESGAGNPAGILEERLSGLRRFRLMVTACRMDVFSHCHEPVTADTISTRLGLQPGLTGLFLDALAAQGLLKNDGAGYSNTAFSDTYLNMASPYCLLDQITLHDHLGGLWDNLGSILHDGQKVYDPEAWFSGLIIPAMAANAKCGILQKTVKAVTALPDFPGARRLLDMGGGHGLYTIAFCQENPDLEGIIFDLPGVLPATRKFIEYYQAGRVSCTPGNFFSDPLGSGFDIVFSSSNPGGKAPALIPKIKAALRPGGLFINKQGDDQAGIDPLLNLEWNLWTVKGMEKNPRQYSFSHSVSYEEYNSELARQGFTIREIVRLDDQSIMTIAVNESS